MPKYFLFSTLLIFVLCIFMSQFLGVLPTWFPNSTYVVLSVFNETLLRASHVDILCNVSFILISTSFQVLADVPSYERLNLNIENELFNPQNSLFDCQRILVYFSCSIFKVHNFERNRHFLILKKANERSFSHVLFSLLEMMVDEHITLVPLLSDCRPDNLKIKWKRRRLLQAGWSFTHGQRARLLKNSSPLPKPNQNGIIFKRASHTAEGPVFWIGPSWILENIL